ILDGELAGRYLVLADDNRVARAQSAGGFQRLLHAEALVAKFDDQVMTAQLARESYGLAIHALPQRGNKSIRRSDCRRGAFGFFQRHHQAVLADRKANARRARPAQRFRQAVVSAAADNGILCPQLPVRKFESRAAVIIQATDQARVDDVRYADRFKQLLHLGEMLAAGLVEVVEHSWQLFNDGLVLGDFAVQDAQRVGDGAALTIGAHAGDNRCKRLAQRLKVARPVIGAANGVQFERPVGDADAIQQSGEHLQHLGVAHRRLAAGSGRADGFRADLVELPVASLLRTLAAELRAHVKELLHAGTLPQLVLDVGAHHPGGIFRTKSEGLTFLRFRPSPVFEGVHLLGDDVRILADGAGEEFRGFNNGSAKLLEVVGA